MIPKTFEGLNFFTDPDLMGGCFTLSDEQSEEIDIQIGHDEDGDDWSSTSLDSGEIGEDWSNPHDAVFLSDLIDVGSVYWQALNQPFCDGSVVVIHPDSLGDFMEKFPDFPAWNGVVKRDFPSQGEQRRLKAFLTMGEL